jgi:hypothetical protein
MCPFRVRLIPVQERRKRRALALARRAGDEHELRRSLLYHSGELLERADQFGSALRTCGTATVIADGRAARCGPQVRKQA